MAKVLLVDDDPGTRSLLSDILEEEGYEVSTAATGFEAIRLTDDNRPDVILLDIDMPGGSGTSVLRNLKQRPSTKEIPVIMVTGYSDTRIMVESVRLGARDYIQKPWHVDEVERSVRWAMKSVGLDFPELA